MRKLTLDLDALAVLSFDTAGRPAHADTGADSGGHYCCGAQSGNCHTGLTDGTVRAHAADTCPTPTLPPPAFAATDPPVCPTGPGCTVPDTVSPNRTCTC